MVVKRRFLLAVTSALTLVMAASAPMVASFEEAEPSPLRKENLLRVRDIAANGTTSAGAIVAVGWREASKPGQLYLAFSTNGGKDYLRSNGKLRKYRIVGDGRLGISLAICGGRVWAGSALHSEGDTAGDVDVLLSSRTIGGGAAQQFMTNRAGSRKVRDVSVACVGKNLIAVAWTEQSNGTSKAKLLLRTLEPLDPNIKPEFSNIFGLGEARFTDGIAVASTGAAVHVAWVKGDGQNIRLKRYLVSGGETPNINPQDAVTLAFKNAVGPQLSARGKRVVLAYTDAGKVKAKMSADLGATFSKASVLSPGTISKPGAVYSVDVNGDRIVVEAAANNNGKLAPKRIQSQNGGASWGTRTFGHKGARVGALLKKKNGTTKLMEAWHNNATPKDTLRAQFEKL
jgi:hypothetical protein